jgi:hypothetical protein
MKKTGITLALILASFFGYSQEVAKENTNTNYENAGETLLNSNVSKGITIGGYGQLDYNEPDGSSPGTLDVHRLVLLFGYKFNDKVSFLTEIELEHVEEIYVEQAYVKYNVAKNVNLMAGLMLVPMGIINEYHEPTTYHGVERPNVDKYIVPTTWRELGIGLSGNIPSASLKYQAYLFNGFLSYKDGVGTLNGKEGLRKARQKGAESVVTSPNFSTKFDYYGINGLRLGLAGYFGKTQTDDTSLENSTVGVSMIGLDARYVYKNIELRGEYIHTSLTNTNSYNLFTGNDVGSKLYGYYGEAAYNFKLNEVQKLTPFLRYEVYNTQAQTEGSLIANPAYDRNELTFGVDYTIANGVAFKMDYQFLDNAAISDAKKQFNAGVAVWF